MSAITPQMRATVKGFLSNLDRDYYRSCKADGICPIRRLAQEVQPDETEVDRVYRRKLREWRGQDDGGPFSRQVHDYAERVAGLNLVFREKGWHSQQTLGKSFYATENDTALFPVFVSAQVIEGLLADSLVPRLVALTERVGSLNVDKVTLTTPARDSQVKLTGEGAELPRSAFTYSEGTVRLRKYGRLVEASYESLATQSVDFFGQSMRRIGRYIGIQMTDDLIATLLDGDGTSGSAATSTDVEVSGTLDYDELIRLVQAFDQGYVPTDFVSGDTNIRTILNMSEFKDPQIQLRFQERGAREAMPVLGGLMHRWTSTAATSFGSDIILALDNRAAVKECRWGDILEEEDSLMNRQIRRFSISFHGGFVKLDNEATQYLNITV